MGQIFAHPLAAVHQHAAEAQNSFSSSGFLQSLFEVFTPRRQCMNYEPDVIWLHVISDLMIALAYYSIPIALIYFVRRRRDLEFNWVFKLFAIFILACGTTHLIGVLDIWIPFYRIDGLMKLFTGLVSLLTAGLLWPLLPKAIALPSPAQLRAANAELQKEITERTAVREQLSREKDFAEALINSSSDGIIAFDRDLRLTAWNPAMEGISGVSREAAIGKRLPEVLPALDGGQQQRLFERAAAGEGPVAEDRPFPIPSRGGSGWLEARYALIPGPAGEATGGLGILRDITDRKLGERELQRISSELEVGVQERTKELARINADLRSEIDERKRVEEALRESEGRLRAVVETAVDGIMTIDERGIVASMNSAAERIFGYTRSEVIGRNVSLLMPQPYRSEHDGYLANYFRTGERRIIGIGREVQGLRKDGSVFPLDLAVSETRVADRRIFTGIVRDVSEQKLAEQALRESEERFRIALGGGSITVFSQDRDLRYRWIYNPHPGLSVESVLGKTDTEIHAPETARRITELKHSVLETGRGTRGEVDVRIEGNILTYHMTIEPLRDQTGAVVGITGAATDVTERKRAEQRLARQAQELVRSNAELEQFASVISHDLRSPLVSIAGCVELLGGECKSVPGSEAEELIGLVRGNVNRMGQLIKSILDYSRLGSGGLQVQECSMEEALEQVESGLKDMIDRTGAVITHDPLPVVRGDQTLLAQLLQNLIENGIKYRSERPPAVHVAASANSDEWVFSVRDNGIGIPPEHSDRLFQMFYRLHPESAGYEGSGIGLATCKKIVERHGGRIWVGTEAGEGATFHFTVPHHPGEH